MAEPQHSTPSPLARRWTDPNGRRWIIEIHFPGQQAMAVPLDFNPRGPAGEPPPKPHLRFRDETDAARQGLVPYSDYPRRLEELRDEELRAYWERLRQLNPTV